jgi:archaellin
MARAKTNISMYRGDSYPITFTLTDSATGSPIDLTGATLIMSVDTMADPPDDTTLQFEIDGVIDAAPETGKVSFTPTSTDTATVGLFYYDVQLTDADGNIRTVAKNTFTITMDITK